MSYKIKLKLSDGTGQNPTDIDCSKYDSTNVFDPHQASFTSQIAPIEGTNTTLISAGEIIKPISTTNGIYGIYSPYLTYNVNTDLSTSALQDSLWSAEYFGKWLDTPYATGAPTAGIYQILIQAKTSSGAFHNRTGVFNTIVFFTWQNKDVASASSFGAFNTDSPDGDGNTDTSNPNETYLKMVCVQWMPLDHDPYGLFIVYAIDTMKSTGEITSFIDITNKVTLKFRCIVPLSGDVVSYSLGAVS